MEKTRVRIRFTVAALIMLSLLATCAAGRVAPQAARIFIGALFFRGAVHQVGTPTEILMRPADLPVAQAVGAKNILHGRVAGRTADGLQVRSGGLLFDTPPYPFEIGAPVYLCVRPERVMLHRKDRPPELRLNQFSGSIVGEISDGLNCTLFFNSSVGMRPLEGAADLSIDMPVHVFERLGLAGDRDWTVSIPRKAIHVISATPAGRICPHRQ